ncbi:hypothetical protein M3Y99_00467400 [Aphelenchoides fujianensis]|nr:hypothetical protein M3Y99_00467400 [Aphelenchoides fujianensis]
MIDEAVCLNAQRLHLADAVQTMQWCEIGMDFVALASITIIAGFLLFFYYLAIIFSLALHVYFKVLRFALAEDACDFVWSPWTCVAFRLPVFYAFIGFSVCHCALFVERALATFGRACSGGRRFGFTLVALLTLLPLLLTAIPLSTDNLTAPRPYCYSNSTMRPVVVIVCMAATALLDVLIAVGDVGVFVANRRSLKKKHTNTYTLASAFRLHQTKLSMEVIFPYATIHALLFLVYVFSVVASNFFSALNSLDKDERRHAGRRSGERLTESALMSTKSVYLCGVPLLVLLLVRGETEVSWFKRQQQTATAEAYFNQYNNNW